MSLYDRDYTKESYEIEEESAYQGRVSTFVKDTYKLVAASLIAAVAGAFIGMSFMPVSGFLMPLLISLALIFGISYADKAGRATLALGLLFVFTFFMGLTLGPVLSFYQGIGAGHVVTQAFIATAVVFGGLTLYAMNTKIDFSSWGRPLFFILIGVVIAGLLNYFLFKSTVGSLLISSVTAILFSAYILYDTQNIIKGVYESPIMAAVGMFLNILNLFISLLNILGITRD
ncbi:MAG: Bax inhibitor-1/YccA family protein [Campylobacter sp.]|nr:Bax inhibitor-1/YccA family protein [Campylobacter sp.]